MLANQVVPVLLLSGSTWFRVLDMSKAFQNCQISQSRVDYFTKRATSLLRSAWRNVYFRLCTTFLSGHLLKCVVGLLKINCVYDVAGSDIQGEAGNRMDFTMIEHKVQLDFSCHMCLLSLSHKKPGWIFPTRLDEQDVNTSLITLSAILALCFYRHSWRCDLQTHASCW